MSNDILSGIIQCVGAIIAALIGAAAIILAAWITRSSSRRTRILGTSPPPASILPGLMVGIAIFLFIASAALLLQTANTIGKFTPPPSVVAAVPSPTTVSGQISTPLTKQPDIAGTNQATDVAIQATAREQERIASEQASATALAVRAAVARLTQEAATQISAVLQATLTQQNKDAAIRATSVAATMTVQALAAQGTSVAAATLTAQAGYTRTKLDDLFKVGNWFCFPDRLDAVGVRRLTPSFSVPSLLDRIDSPNGTFRSGNVAPGGSAATAWLSEGFLPRNQCPTNQLAALTAWDTVNTQPPNRTLVDTSVGANNWRCDTKDGLFFIKISRLTAAFSVAYPFTTIDYAGIKYGVGDVIPVQGGQATGWVAQVLPDSECR